MLLMCVCVCVRAQVCNVAIIIKTHSIRAKTNSTHKLRNVEQQWHVGNDGDDHKNYDHFITMCEYIFHFIRNTNQ